MTPRIPEVRITYGWLLAGVTADALREKHDYDDRLGSFDELTEVANKYEAWWRPYNDKVLGGIVEITGLEFRQNIIDVYVSPWFSPISDPMVIHPAFMTQDALVNILSHELIHRLLTDNTSVDYDDRQLPAWRNAFGPHLDDRTIVHIPVHSILKKLYIDVLQEPSLCELDIERTKDWSTYADAWSYVNEHGYEKIILKVKACR